MAMPAKRPKSIYNRALERSRAAKLGLAEFPIVLGLTVRAAVGGDEHTALSFAERLCSLSQGRSMIPVYEVQANYALGITPLLAWCPGHRARLLRNRRAVLTTRDQHSRHIGFYSQDPGVVCACRGGMLRWHMAQLRAAEKDLEEAFRLAEQLRHPFSINYVLNWRAFHALESSGQGSRRNRR